MDWGPMMGGQPFADHEFPEAILRSEFRKARHFENPRIGGSKEKLEEGRH